MINLDFIIPTLFAMVRGWHKFSNKPMGTPMAGGGDPLPAPSTLGLWPCGGCFAHLASRLQITVICVESKKPYNMSCHSDLLNN